MRREIIVSGVITYESSVSFIKQLLDLDSKSNDPIIIVINSPGGSVPALMAMLDAIDYVKSTVATVNVLQASSAAAVLFAYGSKNNRMAFKYSRTMFHMPRGVVDSVLADSYTVIKELMDAICANCLGITVKEYAKLTRLELFLSADECIELGVCDKKL